MGTAIPDTGHVGACGAISQPHAASPAALMVTSPVRQVHSLEMEMPIASKTTPCPRPECHGELSAFRQVPPKGNLWYKLKVGLGEAGFPNSAPVPSISAG